MAKAFVNLIDGLTLRNPSADLRLSYDSNYLLIEEIRPQGFKSVTDNLFKIPLENIIETMVISQKEIVEKNKSAVGRGLVGGLIFGPAGLILGGLSGVGTKTKAEYNKVYIVSYVGSDGEVKNITFGMTKMMVSTTERFNKIFTKKHKSVSKNPEVQRILSSDANKETIL